MESDPGLARKVDDMFTVPLCRECHAHWHSKAYLPCYEYRSIAAAPDHAQDTMAFRVAHEQSVALMYQQEAMLMAKWIKDYGIDIPQPEDDDESETF
jgi:hypothetical protein